jgi:hypothetical protein
MAGCGWCRHDRWEEVLWRVRRNCFNDVDSSSVGCVWKLLVVTTGWVMKPQRIEETKVALTDSIKVCVFFEDKLFQGRSACVMTDCRTLELSPLEWRNVHMIFVNIGQLVKSLKLGGWGGGGMCHTSSMVIPQKCDFFPEESKFGEYHSCRLAFHFACSLFTKSK